MRHSCRCVQVAIPVYVRHSLNWLGGTQGRFDITVGPKQTMGRTLEKVNSLFQLINLKCSNPLSNNQVKIEIAMHKSVLNCSLTPTQGKYSFDPVSTKDLERKSNIHHTLIRICSYNKTRHCTTVRNSDDKAIPLRWAHTQICILSTTAASFDQ